VWFYAVLFTIVALVTGILGFGGLAGATVLTAKVICLVCGMLVVASLVLDRHIRPTV
jgi:uncharacterized membrane protein YtjA (UPF0391 family)